MFRYEQIGSRIFGFIIFIIATFGILASVRADESSCTIMKCLPTDLRPLEGMSPDSFAQTVKGEISLKRKYSFGPATEKLRLAHPAFKLPLTMSVKFQRDKHGDLVRAPLVVVIVGVHGNGLDDTFDRMMTQLLSESGNHVVLIPNSFSKNYAGSRPLFIASSTEMESQIFYELIRKIKDGGYLPEDKIERTRLVGYSYGAFQAAMIGSRSVEFDHKLGLSKPTIDGDITLISPPLQLRKAQRQIDRLIRVYNQKSKLQIAASVLRYNEGEIAQAILGRHFLDGITQTVLGFKKAEADLVDPRDPSVSIGSLLSEVPKDEKDPKFKAYQASLSYESAMESLTTMNYYWDGDTGSLPFWLKRDLPNGRRINVVMAEDDFLNSTSSEELERLVEVLDPSNLMLFKHGGHGGFVASNWFARFIQRHYGFYHSESLPRRCTIIFAVQ